MAFKVWEFYGKGDPFFGGGADDRLLHIRINDTRDGFSFAFIRACDRRPELDHVAEFQTRDAAERAAEQAAKRAGGLVSIGN